MTTPKRALVALATTTVLAIGVGGCSAGSTTTSPTEPVPSASVSASETAKTKKPKDSPTPVQTIAGTDKIAGSRLTPLPASEEPAALATIEQLSTKGRDAKTGYDRDEFGPSWTDKATPVLYSGNGCYTRDDILVRDLDGVQKRDKCVVVAGTLPDAYSGTTVPFTKERAIDVQIDHLIPLSYSWQMGANSWDEEKRQRFANDPLNLIASIGSLNGQKSDSGPASWLPPSKQIRCAYSLRLAQVALKYELSVTDADKTTLENQCQS